MKPSQASANAEALALAEASDDDLMGRFAAGSYPAFEALYIRHTSGSLLIQENADSSVQRDLEHWLNRLVPEGDDLYTHTAEGPDDMPAHIESALTATSLSIPVVDGELALGTWQGIFLWEHCHHRSERQLLINVLAG